MMTKKQILAMSADELRLEFGELTAQEIRTIRAVVAVIESPDCDALMAHAEAMAAEIEVYIEDRACNNTGIKNSLTAFRSAYPKEEAP